MRLLFSAVFLMQSAVTFADEPRDVALHALRIIGVPLVDGATNRCSRCHSELSDRNTAIETLTHWAEVATNLNTCIERANTPMAKINCTKIDDEYSYSAMGLMAASYHHPRFERLFREAYPQNWEAEFIRFKTKVRMPARGTDLVNETDFAVIEQWIPMVMADGGYLRDLLRGDTPEAPTACEVMAPSAELRQHVNKMATEGWRATNASNGMEMLGCTATQSRRNRPLECLDNRHDGHDVFPLSSAGGAAIANWDHDMPQANFRILYSPAESTHFSYWIRSSPDGRFIGAGAGGSGSDGTIYDLEPMLTGHPARVIGVNQQYDPAFFPDGSGVDYAGGNFCPMSVLMRANVTSIDFSEPGCIQDGNIQLYQSIGAALGRTTDLLAISGYPFDGDSGPRSEGTDGNASWLENSGLNLYPMVQTGRSFEVHDTQTIETPYDADWQLAPSTKLAISRVSGMTSNEETDQMGYRIHILTRAPGSEQYSITKSAQFCARGGKATFSYDEKYVVFHHYIEADEYAEYGYRSANNAEFQRMVSSNISNVYVHDILKGETKRVTRMNPGQNALFPHFRSDGWLTFMVKDTQNDKQYIVTTDAALRL